jgi:hypothetical protein
MASHKPPVEETIRWWTDESGVIHICEGAAPVGTELLLWTLCDREVGPGTAFAPSPEDEVSCRKCAAANDVLKRRAQRAHDKPAPPPAPVQEISLYPFDSTVRH